MYKDRTLTRWSIATISVVSLVLVFAVITLIALAWMHSLKTDLAAEKTNEINNLNRTIDLLAKMPPTQLPNCVWKRCLAIVAPANSLGMSRPSIVRSAASTPNTLPSPRRASPRW